LIVIPNCLAAFEFTVNRWLNGIWEKISLGLIPLRILTALGAGSSPYLPKTTAKGHPSP
jgi:hypothetical protein